VILTLTILGDVELFGFFNASLPQER